MSLIADPEVMSSIPAWPHTFVEIDLVIISAVILLLRLIQEVLQKYVQEVVVNGLVQACPGKV